MYVASGSMYFFIKLVVFCNLEFLIVNMLW
jgi:hypothetical protein